MPLPINPGSLDSISLGQMGGDWISNTTAYTGDWAIIEAIATTVFTTLTAPSFKVNGNALGSGTSLNGITLQANQRLYGRFTAITLTSGTIVAYRATAPAS